jgi:hypothetical protein
MESVTIKRLHGMAKVLGSVLGVSGALVFAFVKGPPLKFMHWHPATENGQNGNLSTQGSSRGEWIKGSLIMLSANTAWCLWLILQVNHFPWTQMMGVFFLSPFCFNLNIVL